MRTNLLIAVALALAVTVACAPPPQVALTPSVAPPPATSTLTPSPAPPTVPAGSAPSAIQHVILIGFDNTHWQEDLQKMPHLLDLFKKGALLRNDHTVLVSHTATNFVAIATGQYPEKTGVLMNTFYDGDRSATWGFWESQTDTGHPLVTTPPPWIAFNRAGYDVGVVGWGDMVLENEREVRTYVPNISQPAANYLGFGIYRHDGTRVLGSPNVDWLYQAVGPFPGWSKLDAAYALKATYEMQTHGIPVTFTYIENVHDTHAPGTYDSALAAADTAFDQFFQKLAASGITPDNTLFAITTDEEDHYVEGGVRTTSLPAWLADNPTFTVPAGDVRATGDASLLVWLKDESKLPNVLPALGNVPGWEAITTRAAMNILHMASASDPDRVPSFVVFAKPDMAYAPFVNASRPGGTKAVQPNPTYLYNHGTLAPEITTVWLALVGPGIARGSFDTWADHTDIRPTIEYAMKMPPSPDLDGRVLFEVLDPALLPAPARAQNSTLMALAAIYKQINAPMGQLGQTALRLSTQSALAAGKPEGIALNDRLKQAAADRDTLAKQLRTLLDRALAGETLDTAGARQLEQQAGDLVRNLNK